MPRRSKTWMTQQLRAPARGPHHSRVGLVARLSPVRGLIIVGALLIVGIVAGAATMVNSFRERAIENASRELDNTALLLTRHFDQQFKDLRRIQRGISAQLSSDGITTPEKFARAMVTYESHLMLKTKVDDEFVGNISIIDADGYLLNQSEAWPPPDISLADRDYFKALKAEPAGYDDEIVEPILSRQTGSWKTLFARRIDGPKGEFLGVVARCIEPLEFEKFFASVMLGESSTFAMFHRDGTLLARFPQSGGVVGRTYRSGVLLQHLRFSNLPATMRTKSPIDDRDRLGTVRLLRDFPIAVVATKSFDSVLKDWQSQTKFTIAIAAVSALIIASLLYGIIRHIQQQNLVAQQRLTLEKNRLGTAIDNMTQGLLLFDANGRVVICNQRYLDMYGLSSQVIVPGCAFRDVIAHRKETGSFSGDVDAYVAEILRDVHRSTTQEIQTTDGRAIQILSRPVADGGWVATHEDITERRNAEDRIAHLAHYDALTDLPNRTLFRTELQRALTRAENGSPCAVLYIDIDEFKGINDSLGHPVGDELLKGIASRLRTCVNDADVVARLGGDEFAIVKADARRDDDVTDLIGRIFAAIRQPFDCLGHSLLTDASIGIALAPRDGTDLDELLKNADLAMYGAKSEGRRTFRFFEPQMDARVKARRLLELELRHAAGDGDFAESGFEVFYQPVVNLRDDSVVGCEALLRWRHPERGMISPAEFVPVAEEIGVISQLGEWVLNTACHEAAGWPADIKVAVNVSPIQFRSATFALKVASALAATGLAARRLELEITEAVLIRDVEAASAILNGLRDIGVRTALDDFGTGYSSLSYLQRFPFDKIKIDRCFVTDLAKPEGSSSIVQAVVNIAASRNMTTTAEGVETVSQKQMLRELGCTEMQGYLFSAAKPAAEIRKLLATCRPKTAEAAA